MKLGRWSPTAASNNTSPPDGWPEGQAPSTVNDCAREMMASIRTAFTDPQFFDQDLTPSFVNATTFTVPGTQTSALHAGRRLKLFDAGNTQYAEILSSTATANTQVVISGTAITAALTSMAIGILESTFGNTALPRRVTFDTATISSLAVTSTITASSIAATGPVRFDSTLSVSGTIAAANVTRAWARFDIDAGGTISAISSFNIASMSRSAAGVYRINFTNAFSDSTYGFMISAYVGDGTLRGVEPVVGTGGSLKFRTRHPGGTVADATTLTAAFFR